MKKANILEQLSPEDALAIVRRLAQEDKTIRNRIEQIAKEYLGDVDMDGIADDVYYELNGLDVEELWDTSGRTRYGYIEPHERAGEMIEEALEPFIEEMKKCRKLSMIQEEKIHCMAILKGIYRYEKESTSDFSDWATDVPGESFDYVLNVWKKEQKNPEDISEMEEFIKQNCPGW